MIYDNAQEHFRWIGIIADRIICAKDSKNELPLLSLSFLDENRDLTKYSNLQRPSFPIKIEDLSNAKLYGIIVSAISSNQKSDSIEQQMDFDSILEDLSNEGYKPQKPCDSSGLSDGILEHHVNLCKSIEFLVVDRSLNISMLISDLRRLPRSFFVLKSDMQIDLLEDAVSLWLSKFHCNVIFDQEICTDINEDFKKYNLSEKNYKMQIDASNYAKVAACLARIFPKQINKNEIKKGNNEEEILNNKNLSKIILDELHAFVIEKFPTDEHLFMLFISDLFYATRSGAKKFVKLEQTPPLQKAHSLPQPHLQLKDAELNRPKTAPPLIIRKPLYPEKETKIIQSPTAIKQSPTKLSQSQQKPKITKPKVESKKEKEKVIPKKKEKNLQPSKNSKNAKSAPPPNKKVKANPRSNKKEPSKDTKSGHLNPQNEAIQKVDSDEKLNEEEDLIYKNQQESNIIKKPKLRKYILEFPEIEILLSRIIQKFPQNEIYYRNIYDIFMQVMQAATIVNSPNISEIFAVSKAAFNQLLDGQEKLEFDFEQKIRSLLKKTSSNDESKKETNKNEQIQNYDINDSNKSSSIENFLQNEVEEKTTFINNEENENHEFNDKSISDDECESSNDVRKDACDIINDDIESTEDNKNYINSASKSIFNDNKGDENERSNCDFSYDKENNENCISSNDDENNENCISNNDDENNENCISNNEYENNENYISNNEYENNENYISNNEYENNENYVNNNEYENNENYISNNEYENNENYINNNDYENNENYISNNEYENNENYISSNDYENKNERIDFDQNISDDFNNKNDAYYNEKISNNNDDSDFVSNKKIDNKTDFADNNSNSNRENRVTFTLPDNFKPKSLNRRPKSSYSYEFENKKEENDSKNFDFSFVNNQNKGEFNQEDVDEEEEMADEMILREAEQTTSQKFNSKLKQLSSSHNPKSTTLKKSSTVPNHRTILNALRFNSLPCPKHKKLLDSITDLLNDFKDKRILLLMASRTLKFKGIYILSSEGNSAQKIWGSGPNEIQNDDVNNFFKYINGQKTFEIIASKSFTQTTDGFSLKKPFESGSW